MRCTLRVAVAGLVLFSFDPGRGWAGVGDPQVRTDHPWYPGELACSTFDRLAATQAALYERVTGIKPESDQDRALAAWLWRNTHYYHGEQGVEDLWGAGFGRGPDPATRAYWTGLFAHGCGLCGTTHSQWTAEMEHLLGHNRARCVGVTGHNSFEVFLTGGPYGEGRWALLDHDVSTVVFDDAGERLLSIAEIGRDARRWTDRAAAKQGWLPCGLYPGDGGAFDSYRTAEYLAGYSGPPPIVNLRRGETLRRYLEPGLEDGKTFVFWGRNYRTGGVPGPERSRTWVNQPEKMYGSKDGTPHVDGQARYGNAVYTYTPDFASGDYREGVVEEDDGHVVFEFYTPYIIAATPASDADWGIYEPGCRNGLVVTGRGGCGVLVSVDQGQTWHDGGNLNGSLDLTDRVKGHRQYWLRFDRGAVALRAADIRTVTVCQANAAILPRLKDNGSRVEFEASGSGIVSAGPNLRQAAAHVVAGKFDSPTVTLQLATPRGEPATSLHAAAHVRSSNPPSPDVVYRIEMSLDQGRTWRAVVADWRITRRGEEPPDFWSQSFCYGSAALDDATGPVQVRFRNDGGKQYARAEMHLAYRLPQTDATRVTFCWSDDAGEHTESHTYGAGAESGPWQISTGNDVKTEWVEYAPWIMHATASGNSGV